MKRVLIADDEPIERMIVSRTIEKYFSEELTVVSAANGREAVEQFSGAAPTVTAIGGCSRSVSLRECIHGGYFAGRNIEYY